jgi:hypothetical protein
MPVRRYTVAIIAFWLAASGWLFYREIWPQLRPGEPPSYTIDQVDEARQQPIRWTIYEAETGREGPPKELGRVETQVTYRERGETYRREHGETRGRERDEAVDGPRDDTYELWCKVKFINVGGSDLQLVLEDTYRITRDGDLREIIAEVLITSGRVDWFRAHLEGPVRDGRFVLEGWTDRPDDRGRRQKSALKTEPVQVPGRGSVMNQLHPVNRMPGLRLGQHWHVPLFDPLRVALSGASSDDPLLGPALFFLKQLGQNSQLQPRELQAEVQSERVTLVWDGQDQSCLLIDYHAGAELVARTWVRARDGLVLQQEGTYLDKRVLLKRVLIK